MSLYFFLTLFYLVIQNGTQCSEGSRVHSLMFSIAYAPEILPPFGRLDDIKWG